MVFGFWVAVIGFGEGCGLYSLLLECVIDLCPLFNRNKLPASFFWTYNDTHSPSHQTWLVCQDGHVCLLAGGQHIFKGCKSLSRAKLNTNENLSPSKIQSITSDISEFKVPPSMFNFCNRPIKIQNPDVILSLFVFCFFCLGIWTFQSSRQMLSIFASQCNYVTENLKGRRLCQESGGEFNRLKHQKIK